jgi:hypothetical protein
MADPTFAPAGAFCWTSLISKDLAASKAFFASLLGWEAHDLPGMEGAATMFRLGGLDVAGGMAHMPQQGPPTFHCYVQVADADAAVAKARELGGSVLMGPFPAGGLGRMAFLQDPTGAVFAIWQALSHKGASIFDVPGAHCWTELSTQDLAAAEAFYTALFGWTIKHGEGGGMVYDEFALGDKHLGGMYTPNWPGAESIPSNWSPYYMVEDVDAKAAQAKDLGGSVLNGPMDIPNVGRFAVLQEPGGAVFNLYQPDAGPR